MLTYVIYSGGIRNAREVLDCGGYAYRIFPVYLTQKDADEVFAFLTKKTERGELFTDEDFAQLSLTPLMASCQSKKDTIKKAILFVKQENSNVAEKTLAMLYTLADKFLRGKELEEIKEEKYVRYIEFGENKEKVSEIIMGLMRISDMTVKETAALIDTGLEEGINFLDLADIYGNGKSEEIVGSVFTENPGLREKVFLQSKCGIRIDPDFTYFDFSKDYILEATDKILSRLHTDHLDSLLLHRPDALMEPEEIAEAFDKLYNAGKVRNFGVSNMTPMMMEMLQREVKFPICANQIQLSCAVTQVFDAGFHMNMQCEKGIMRDGGGVLEYCRMNKIPVQAWSSLQYGYFQGVFLGSEKYPELNAVLDRIAKENGVTSMAVALAWILRYPGATQAVIGTTKASRVREAVKATEFQLSKKEWYEIYLAAGNDLP